MIVVFTKPHNYGGVPYGVDDKLDGPDERMAQLVSIGVAELDVEKKIAKPLENKKNARRKT